MIALAEERRRAREERRRRRERQAYLEYFKEGARLNWIEHIGVL